ncbi:MAG: cysteine hydrolase [Dehalococcoidia bacterium]|nr:cysteine hydrolase [Dehalococcoidia bacterium]
MTTLVLDTQKTAMLFFDMLNVYCRRGDEAALKRTAVQIANCVRLMEASRRAGVPIFHAKGEHRPDGADTAFLLTDADYSLKPWADPIHPSWALPKAVRGSWEGEVIDELKPQAGDYVIPKQRWSAFYQTNLELSLRNRGINNIILAGGSTDVGIAATAYDARDRDYNLVIVSDACSTAHLEANHRQFMDYIFPRMARVRTTEQVLAMFSARA